jgi:hypothetical protein
MNADRTRLRADGSCFSSSLRVVEMSTNKPQRLSFLRINNIRLYPTTSETAIV